MSPPVMDWPHWTLGGGGDLLDPVVAGVGDVHVAGGSTATPLGLISSAEVAAPPSPVVPGDAGGAAGDGVDVAGGHRDAVVRAAVAGISWILVVRCRR